ncbi:superoxide dismutase family protein [Granulicella sp. dw_53]|uniref:superoxide dismutase family protein n=1 Tax=Granulicella sp. dw_53 TaxID=2719792 RepID=UPI001BD577E7|nr:superoxide dismutase family protein [Granulicella sp. dw_53]
MRFPLAALSICLLASPAFAKSSSPTYKVDLKNSQGEEAGTVTLKQVKKGVNIKIQLKNLPVGEHAVHIHAKPLCEAPDFKSAAGHFNPENKQHGLQNPMGHHDGDLPQNIMVGEGHTGEATFTINYISLDPNAPNSVIANGGTSIVVHEKADDMKTDPTGNAGNRLACGVLTPAL